MDLSALRQKIDSLDTTLVNLLNERARVSLDVGAAKKAAASASDVQKDPDPHVYIPTREKQIYEKLKRLNKGPLNQDSLQAIFREVIVFTYLVYPSAPPRSSTHPLLRSCLHPSPCKKKSQSPTSARRAPTPTSARTTGSVIASHMFRRSGSKVYVFDAVERGRTTYGIVPFENSSYGSVVVTLDRLIDTELRIRAEAYLGVHHTLMSNSPLDAIKKVYSHPQALGQCKRYLDTHHPVAERIPVTSTSAAAELAARETGAAAICSLVCAELYGLNVREQNIEDVKSEF
ncbi:Prephenate dehydratase-domain-containing protein [Jimgerdemannia flammicorona]|uniref:Bifunctional chorismate mutase/prephenate dehydratase n=1 Tax=Jimgerdemannia flammicorona TaxID=994334 RepID=A0A433D3V5_9FUNG|nr:Prephenate dehydratase-domain-containing protein [Jimgerdemannia flammicorona]